MNIKADQGTTFQAKLNVLKINLALNSGVKWRVAVWDSGFLHKATIFKIKVWWRVSKDIQR